jgi:hypothetical protein
MTKALTKIKPSSAMNTAEAIAQLLDDDLEVSFMASDLMAYKTDSWNYFKDGKYVGPGVDGAVHHGYIVRQKKKDGEEEKAFITALAAANYFLACK